MAKNFEKKKTSFGVMQDIQKQLFSEEQSVEVKKPVVVKKPKERQTERLQMTIKPSLKQTLMQYCEDQDIPMNKLVLDLIEDKLKAEGYL